MGFMGDMASLAGNSVIGNAERAVIEIMDYRKKEIAVTEGSIQTPALKSPIPNVAGMAKKALQTASLTSADIKEKFAPGLANTGTVKQFKVQFNPSSLNLSAQGSEKASIRNISGDGMNYTSDGLQTRMTLSVDLIFDRVNNQDAFMNEKFVLNPTSAISGITKAVVNTTTGREYTVQPQVEGFIAALRNSNTRLVTFCWGRLRYTGILKRVDADYTMFSVSGKPIRASVRLEIELSDPKIAGGEMGYWAKQYQAAFGGK